MDDDAEGNDAAEEGLLLSDSVLRSPAASSFHLAPESGEQIDNYIPPDLLEEANIDVAAHPDSRRYNTLRIWRRANWVFAVYLVPVTIALIVVLLIDRGKKCDRPLQTWCLVQSAIQLVVLAINCYVLLRMPRSTHTPEEQESRYRIIYALHLFNRLVNFVWFGWFIIGMIWVFEALPHECPHTAPNLFKMSFALIIIQMVLFCLVVLFCCCSCFLLLLRFIINPDPNRRAPRGASQVMINSLTSLKFETDSMLPENAMCAICLCEYEVGEEVRYLPCKHHFHQQCIDKWLRGNKSCPFCKRLIDQTKDTPEETTSRVPSSTAVVAPGPPNELIPMQVPPAQNHRGSCKYAA